MARAQPQACPKSASPRQEWADPAPGSRQRAPSAEPSPSPAKAPRTLVRDHDRVDHLVGEGLAAVVPQRPQEADVAGKAVQDVGEVADEGHATADRLAVVHAQQLQAERLLAPRLPGATGKDAAVVDPDADGGQVQQG